MLRSARNFNGIDSSMCGFLDPRLAVSLCIPICCAIWMGCIPTATAADRTTGYFPLPSHSPTPDRADPGEAIPAGEANASGLGGVADRTAPRGRRPYDGFDLTTAEDWRRYLQVWEAHHRNPADRAIRQFLGLPPEAAVIAIPRRGRSAPRELGWRLGTYRQIETPHFQLFTRGDEPSSQRIAEDLEKCFWIWTQTFFPLNGLSQCFQQTGLIPGEPPFQRQIIRRVVRAEDRPFQLQPAYYIIGLF